MKILSVDWDFFFPNSEMFDWGHNETMLFFETIWQWRVNNRHLLTKAHVKDYMKPNRKLLRNFWDRAILDTSKVTKLVIAESHSSMVPLMNLYKGKLDVVNYDAHHDMGYDNRPFAKREPDCGNWASKDNLKIGSYQIVYPDWRFKEPESQIPSNKIYYSYEPWPRQNFDIVFICRSGCWTPTWYDQTWINFVSYWKNRRYLWDTKMTDQLALRRRHPTLKELPALIKKAQLLENQLKEERNKLKEIANVA